jgi:hypothetical protein
VVCCYHLSSVLFVFCISRVVFLKYIALKTYLVFRAHYTKNIFLVRVTAVTVGYFGRVPFKVVPAPPVLHET